MRRAIKEALFRRIGDILDEDVTTDGFFNTIEEFNPSELEHKEAVKLMRKLAQDYYNKADRFGDKK